MKRMTKRQAIEEFRYQFKGVHRGDRHAREYEWYSYIEELHFEGLISEKQFLEWKYPFGSAYAQQND